jgi:hypothetical protein
LRIGCTATPALAVLPRTRIVAPIELRI